NATNTTMSMVKSQVGDDLFGKISSAIPGAQAAAESDAPAAPASGGGLMGSLTSMASSALGGNAGGGLELVSSLTSGGLGADQVGGFATMFIDFIKAKVGDEVTEQILGKIPMLKSLLG
ncbi:MAG: hypothetical protein AAFN70_00365, partial [Planctomycetota bacterium]